MPGPAANIPSSHATTPQAGPITAPAVANRASQFELKFNEIMQRLPGTPDPSDFSDKKTESIESVARSLKVPIDTLKEELYIALTRARGEHHFLKTEAIYTLPHDIPLRFRAVWEQRLADLATSGCALLESLDAASKSGKRELTEFQAALLRAILLDAPQKILDSKGIEVSVISCGGRTLDLEQAAREIRDAFGYVPESDARKLLVRESRQFNALEAATIDGAKTLTQRMDVLDGLHREMLERSRTPQGLLSAVSTLMASHAQISKLTGFSMLPFHEATVTIQARHLIAREVEDLVSNSSDEFKVGLREKNVTIGGVLIGFDSEVRLLNPEEPKEAAILMEILTGYLEESIHMMQDNQFECSHGDSTVVSKLALEYSKIPGAHIDFKTFHEVDALGKMLEYAFELGIDLKHFANALYEYHADVRDPFVAWLEEKGILQPREA